MYLKSPQSTPSLPTIKTIGALTQEGPFSPKKNLLKSMYQKNGQSTSMLHIIKEEKDYVKFPPIGSVTREGPFSPEGVELYKKQIANLKNTHSTRSPQKLFPYASTGKLLTLATKSKLLDFAASSKLLTFAFNSKLLSTHADLKQLLPVPPKDQKQIKSERPASRATKLIVKQN